MKRAPVSNRPLIFGMTWLGWLNSALGLFTAYRLWDHRDERARHVRYRFARLDDL